MNGFCIKFQMTLFGYHCSSHRIVVPSTPHLSLLPTRWAWAVLLLLTNYRPSLGLLAQAGGHFYLVAAFLILRNPITRGEPVHHLLSMLVKRPRVVAVEKRCMRLSEFSQERERCARKLARKVLVIGFHELSKRERFLTSLSIQIG